MFTVICVLAELICISKIATSSNNKKHFIKDYCFLEKERRLLSNFSYIFLHINKKYHLLPFKIMK